MLRGVCDALGDLARELVHRALSLREHIHDLCAPAVTECLRYRRQGVEQRRLCRSIHHICKLSLEHLRVKLEGALGARREGANNWPRATVGAELAE